ncbi:MAG: M23 family metallopeptidase [Candidatus Yanofskybacteria bacterium]|nr:M23 family metallopeptidase [Candidatus Yanofskybacteria bacterium]
MKILLTAAATLLFPYIAFGQSFRALNQQVQQGGVLVLRVAPQWQGPQVSIAVFAKHYLPNRYGDVYIGIDKSIVPGKHIATLVEYGRGIRLSWDYEEIEVVDKNLPSRTRRPFVPNKKWERERETIRQAFDGGDYFEKYFNGEFVRPLDRAVIDQNRTIGDESSPFGTNHNGVDLITLDPKTRRHKRPVKAINSGKIALIARNYSTDGNMMIIDHGSGIFSVYMHLSRFLVSKVGQTVKKGDVVAMSGDTGSARTRPSCKNCGPHLHCSVKIRSKDGKSDVYVDPLAFIETMNRIF